MKLGHFRYAFEGPPESRLLKGSHGFILQYNPKRASQRRAPQAMLHLEQAFNHVKFNFTKIDEEKEVIFQLRRLDGEVGEVRFVCIYVYTCHDHHINPIAGEVSRSSDHQC